MKKLSLIFTSLAIIFIFSITPALAETIIDRMQGSFTDVALPTTESPEGTIGSIINIFLSLFGIIFFALMIFAGFRWITSQGKEEEVKKAQATIRSAIIGLAVVFLAFAISTFVVGRITKSVGQVGEAPLEEVEVPEINYTP